MSDKVVALLSIHPLYAFAILDGAKRVEFRKRIFKRDVDTILMYASHPVMHIVGGFDVDGIVETTPALAWERFGAEGFIDREAYNIYYSGSEKAVAIQVKGVFRFNNPVGLSVIGKEIRAPQSYRYIAEDQFHSVLEKST